MCGVNTLANPQQCGTYFLLDECWKSQNQQSKLEVLCYDVSL